MLEFQFIKKALGLQEKGHIFSESPPQTFDKEP